jgi:hypothetical protein
MATWTVQYDANELPADATPAWLLTGFDIAESVNNGILTVDENGTANHHYGLTDIGLDFDIGITNEIKLKMTTGEFEEAFANEVASPDNQDYTYAEFNVYETKVVFPSWLCASGEEASYEMDTTNDYHIYRMVAYQDNLKLYVDDILRLDETTSTAGWIDEPTDWYEFGKLLNTGPVYWQIDYNYISALGAYPVTTTTTSTTSSTSTSTSTSTSSTTTIRPFDAPGGDIIVERIPVGEIYNLS